MKNSEEAGFTLIEIIIVILIAGIVVTMASLNFNANQGSRELKQFAEQLTQKLMFASQLAELLPGEFGFSSNGNAGQFYQLITENGQARWLAIDNRTMLQPQRIPEAIVLTIETDGINRIVTENDLGFSPAIEFFSNGNITPFKITIFNNKQRANIYTIVGNLAGEIRLE